MTAHKQHLYFSELHKRALQITKDLHHQEFLMIEILQSIDREKVYRFLKFTSLFQYAVNALGLPECRAYNFILVARKASQVEKLQVALKNKKITLSKAKKISPVINSNNADYWLELAQRVSQRSLEGVVAKVNPSSAVQEGTRFIAERFKELRAVISVGTDKAMRRVQDVLSQKKSKPVSLDETLTAAFSLYLEKRDPVVMADRIIKRKMRAEAKKAEKTKGKTNGSEEGDQIARTGQAAKDKPKINDEVEKSRKNAAAESTRRDDQADTIEPLDLTKKMAESPETEKDKSSQRSFSKIKHKQNQDLNSNYKSLGRVKRLPILASLNHQVAVRDQGQCRGLKPDNTRCPNQRWLDVHHVKPVSQGGLNIIENLLTLCKAHHHMEHVEQH